ILARAAGSAPQIREEQHSVPREGLFYGTFTWTEPPPLNSSGMLLPEGFPSIQEEYRMRCPLLAKLVFVLAGVGLYLAVPSAARAQGVLDSTNYAQLRYWHYPYYYFPHNYWPTMSPRWPELPG